jgi:hypothetical protein
MLATQVLRPSARMASSSPERRDRSFGANLASALGPRCRKTRRSWADTLFALALNAIAFGLRARPLWIPVAGALFTLVALISLLANGRSSSLFINRTTNGQFGSTGSPSLVGEFDTGEERAWADPLARSRPEPCSSTRSDHATSKCFCI